MVPEVGVIGDPPESFVSTEIERIVARFEAFPTSVGSPYRDIAAGTVGEITPRFGRFSLIENGVTSDESEKKLFSFTKTASPRKDPLLLSSRILLRRMQIQTPNAMSNRRMTPPRTIPMITPSTDERS